MPKSDEVELRAVGGAHTGAPAEASPVTGGHEGTEESKEIGNPFQQLKGHVTGSLLNTLYVFVPIAIVAGYGQWSPEFTFCMSFLGLIPLAAALGDFTEDIALRTNDGIGALINVTFGNATELIISIAALRYGEYELIKNSLVGSVLGNMLLVLGTSIVVAGLKAPDVRFRAAAAQTYMASLILASFGFMVPTVFFSLNPDSANPHFALEVSRQISVLLIIMYAAYIFFQMKTHKHLFDAVDDGGEEEEEDPQFTFGFAFTAIGVVAVLIGLLSDFLVDSVEGAASGLHVSKHFITMILIPIVGNVAEHASAIIMASKGKLDICVGIALGSSIQIGMFAMPVICICAWLVGRPLNMNITPFTAGVLMSTVILTYSVVAQGVANWLTGMKLLVAYMILTIAFLNAPDDRLT